MAIKGNIGSTNNGEYDILIAKYDTNSNKIWTRLLGSISNDKAGDITLSPEANYIYITGYTDGNIGSISNNWYTDILLAKYASNGSRLWIKLIGRGTYDYARGITVSPNGTYPYLTGYTRGTIGTNTNQGYYDILITKHNESGELLKSRIIGEAYDDKGLNITYFHQGAA